MTFTRTATRAGSSPARAPTAVAATSPTTAASTDRPVGGASISEFLSGLASWKPAGADVAATVEEPEEVGGDEEAIPDLEPWEEASASATQQTEPLPWEQGFEQSSHGARADDLLDLDAESLDAPAGGTGPAGEEEPFPWEMPGGTSLPEAAESGEIALKSVKNPVKRLRSRVRKNSEPIRPRSSRFVNSASMKWPAESVILAENRR